MAQPQHTPVVPLEAGAGPENPPCPACGEPLFGLIAARPGLAGPVSACESCGLGVVGGPASAGEALRDLDRLTDGGEVAIANRGGLLGLARRRRLVGPAARRRLPLHGRGGAPPGRQPRPGREPGRWAPGAGIASMWQTVLNSVTFGRNVALGALGERGAAVAARRPWQRRLDALISVVVAIPALVDRRCRSSCSARFSSGRGGALKLRLELL